MQTEEKRECRYCFDEEYVSQLESPCRCTGTLKYVHKSCIARWCNIKSNRTCEICKQIYSGNYSEMEAPNFDHDHIDIEFGWEIPQTNPPNLIDHYINCPEDFTFGTTLFMLVALLVTKLLSFLLFMYLFRMLQ